MGSKGGSQQAPDYTGAAIAEGEALQESIRQQTAANRSNQYNPFGQSEWTKETDDEGYDQWTQNTQLAGNTYNADGSINTRGDMQTALDSQLGMMADRSATGAGLTEALQGDLIDPATGKYKNLDWTDFNAESAIETNPNSPFYGEQSGGGRQLLDYEKNSDIRQSPGIKDLTARNTGISLDSAAAGDLQQRLDFSGAPQLSRQNMMQATGFQDPGLGGQNLQTDLDYSGASAVGTGAEQRQRAEDAIYDRGASRLDRRMQQGGDDLEIKLRGQGLQPGDQAYDRAMRDFTEQKTDAYQTLGNEAIMGGGQEATRTFGMDMDRRGMMTGEQDRMGEYRNQALSGQFGIDAQRQAQMQNIAQSETGFGNQARGQQFGQDAQRRQQALDATSRQGDFANQATGQQYQMDQDAAQTRYDQFRQGQEFQNTARDQQINEEIVLGQENRSRNREWVDQQNALRSQRMTEAQQQRQQGMNEVSAWMSGQQVQSPQFGSYNQAHSAGAPQLLQAAGMQGQQQAANQSAANAGMGGMMSGLGSIAGAIPWSDRRLKKNIKRIGTKKGYPWYSFDYIWGESSEGVMADEIPEEFRVKDGEFNRVNYGALFA